jgi:hypothetical protein
MWRLFSAGATLLLLVSGCSGATTRDPNPGDDGLAGAPGHSPSGPAPADEVSCTCVHSSIAWWRDGGLVPVVRKSRIEACAEFRNYEETAPGEPSEECGSTLSGCEDSLGIDDVNEALRHPDVQDALERAPILFGGDLRPLDGQIDHIEIDGKVVEVGVACDDPACAIPEGVARLDRMLGYLQIQEHERAVCLE